MNVLTILHTNGRGYWSSVKKAIKIVDLKVPYISEDNSFGELRVYFSRSWNVKNYGLIYSDPLFKHQLCAWLAGMGIDASDVCYSEQGMQGHNYVSFDVGRTFLQEWTNRNGVAAMTT